MRTTLTLDPDVAAKARQGARKLGRPFKEVINAALRIGLDHVLNPPAPTSPIAPNRVRWGCAPASITTTLPSFSPVPKGRTIHDASLIAVQGQHDHPAILSADRSA